LNRSVHPRHSNRQQSPRTALATQCSALSPLLATTSRLLARTIAAALEHHGGGGGDVGGAGGGGSGGGGLLLAGDRLALERLGLLRGHLRLWRGRGLKGGSGWGGQRVW